MRQQKLPISTFSHYKSMETISCHSNQSSYPIGTKKTILFVPPAYRCYMWNMARMSFTTSEEMSFENVDGDDDWRTDEQQLPGYTISWPMSLRLRCTKNEKKKINRKLNNKSNLRDSNARCLLIKVIWSVSVRCSTNRAILTSTHITAFRTYSFS